MRRGTSAAGKKEERKKKKKKKEEEKKEEEEEEEFYLDSNDFGFVCAGVINMSGYQRNARYSLSCLLQNNICFSVVFLTRAPREGGACTFSDGPTTAKNRMKVRGKAGPKGWSGGNSPR